MANDLQAIDAFNRNGLAWAIGRWQAEVANRPLQNVHRRSLDDTWRQVMRYFGGNPESLVGPAHDALLAGRELAEPFAPESAAVHRQIVSAVNGIAANWYHDEGAIAQCGYCKRYTLDRKALSDRQPTCTCGQKHGWSGAFVKPGPDAQWHGAAPTEPRPAGTQSTPSAEWRHLGGTDPHEGRYDGERAALCMGHLSDDALANGAFLNYDARPSVEDLLSGRGKNPIVWMTAVKDRIRWLARTLEKVLARATEDHEYASRYQWLRERPLDAVQQGGVFAGKTPDNVVLNGTDLDAAIDAERISTAMEGSPK